jgi:hypothetical protein
MRKTARILGFAGGGLAVFAGVIGLIADWAVVFLPYLASGVFLAIGAVTVFSSPTPAANPAIR